MSDLKLQKIDLQALTKKLMVQFLMTKGSVFSLQNYASYQYYEVVNILKIIHVLGSVGMIYFTDSNSFIYLGTNKTILKYIRFAKEKIRNLEAEVLNKGKNSTTSGEAIQNYLFRAPKELRTKNEKIIKIGSFEFSSYDFHMLCDFVEQVVMEMLFDPSFLKRQIN